MNSMAMWLARYSSLSAVLSLVNLGDSTVISVSMIQHGGVMSTLTVSGRLMLIADVLTNVVEETRLQRCTKGCLMWVSHSLFGNEITFTGIESDARQRVESVHDGEGEWRCSHCR